MADACPICAKHRGEGPLVGGPELWRAADVVVFHAPPGADGTVALGHLFVESVRHVPYLDHLTEPEAEAVGRAVRRAAVALRAALDPEHVFSAVVGRGVAHFHQHLFVRARGAPADLAWHASDEWPGAPRGDRAAVEALAARLRAHR
jgi:diadenosine tetraphosphate (Ap4A) HIT family hydrolase